MENEIKRAAEIDGLVFDAERHSYFYNGKKIPGVTQILRDAGVIQNHSYSDPFYYLNRGKLIHLACEYFDLQTLDFDSIDPAIAGYVESYKQFREISSLEILGIEKMVFCATWQFAGTIDRIVSLNGTKAIIDIKSGQPEPWHGLQLAAYDLADGFNFLGKYGLYLQADGSPAKLKKYDDESDYDLFKACVNLYNWKQNGYGC